MFRRFDITEALPLIMFAAVLAISASDLPAGQIVRIVVLYVLPYWLGMRGEIDPATVDLTIWS